MSLTIYTTLARLPLFQGMSIAELEEVVPYLRFNFQKAREGEVIAHDGMAVEGMVFVMNGSIRVETAADDGGYSVMETLPVPCVLQPERLFGLKQYYSRTFTATSACQMLSLDKADVIKLTTSSEVFRLNLLNILCTMTQRMQMLPWKPQQQDIRKKISTFIRDHSLRPAGAKEVHIGMVRLGHEISESRLNVSRALGAMHREGLLDYRRGVIIVPALENIL